MFMRCKKNIDRFFRWRSFNYNQYNLLSFILLCLLVFLLFKGIWIIERNLRPAFLSMAQVKAHTLAVDAVNKAVIEEVAHGIYYQDLISIKVDNNGKIVMAQINALEMNRLIAKTTLAAQNALKEMGKETVRIPLGEIFDSYLLAAYGPKLPLKLVPAGKINATLLDSFEEAGINQVRHKIYLDIVTEMRVVIPFSSESVKIHTTVPLADTIYPGEIPESIVNLIIGAFKPE